MLYQRQDGSLVANPRDLIRTAPSVTKALQGDPPRDHLITGAMVLPLGDGPGQRVPIHHRGPKWAPSTDWTEVLP